MPYLSPRSVLIALTVYGLAVGQPSPVHASVDTPELPALPGLEMAADQGNAEWMAPQLSSALYLTVEGLVAHAQLFQTFDNPSNETVDAVYHFPLPPSAAVSGLQLQVGDRALAGQLLDREQASRLYQQTRIGLAKTSWLQTQRPHWVSLQIANIGPGETVEVSLSYEQEVHHDRGVYSLMFPVTQTPADNSGDNAGQPSGEGPWLHAEVTFDSPNSIYNVRSPSHALDTLTEPDGSTRVRLRYGPLVADRHFQVQWQQHPGSKTAPVFQEEAFAGEQYALLEVQSPSPQTEELESKEVGSNCREVVFVVDSTKSMQGEALNQAIISLQLGLERLAPEDTFNVVVFNTVPQALFSQSQPATPAHLKIAHQLAEALTASGDSQLLPALRLALESGKKSLSPSAIGNGTQPQLRQVLLFTDGSHAQDSDALRFAEQNRHEMLLYTVGLGSAANWGFTSDLARLGQGVSLHSATVDALDDSLPTFLDQLAAPRLQQLQVVFQGIPQAQIFPDTLAPLHAGSNHWVIAKLSTENHGASVRGQFASSALFQIDKQAVHTRPASGLHRLWAQRKLQAATDEQLRKRVPPPATRIAQLQHLAQKHQLLSRYTSWIAIDSTPSVSRIGRTIAVPLAPAAGTPAATPSEFAENNEPTCSR